MKKYFVSSAVLHVFLFLWLIQFIPTQTKTAKTFEQNFVDFNLTTIKPSGKSSGGVSELVATHKPTVNVVKNPPNLKNLSAIEKNTVAFDLSSYMNLVVKNNTPPVYPRAARLRGEVGQVVVRVWVHPSGRFSKDLILEKSSTSELLNQTVMETVAKWNFPGFSGAQDISFLIPFEFSLN